MSTRTVNGAPYRLLGQPERQELDGPGGVEKQVVIWVVPIVAEGALAASAYGPTHDIAWGRAKVLVKALNLDYQRQRDRRPH